MIVDGQIDLLIDLPTPFFYDPARGNLLLDFRNISPAAMPNGNLSLDYGFTYDSSQVGYLWDRGTGVDSGQRRGLVTQFTVAPAPEPATAALLCAGVALCLARRRSVERAWR